jgi:hypothetical protein
VSTPHYSLTEYQAETMFPAGVLPLDHGQTALAQARNVTLEANRYETD